MWSEAQSLTTPGPDISFNTGGASDDYILDPDQCRWVPDMRVTADPKPRAAGAVIFPILKGAGRLFLAGVMIPTTDTAAARDTMIYNLEAACDAIMTADGTYTHPDRGTLTVRCEVWPGVAGGFRKTFSLVLIAADPTGW